MKTVEEILRDEVGASTSTDVSHRRVPAAADSRALVCAGRRRGDDHVQLLRAGVRDVAAFAVLGYISPVIAVVNLLPVRPLNGANAWRVVPILMRRVVRRAKRERDVTPMEAMERALRNAQTKK